MPFMVKTGWNEIRDDGERGSYIFDVKSVSLFLALEVGVCSSSLSGT